MQALMKQYIAMYGMPTQTEMEMQELFFKKIGKTFKNVGKKIVNPVKKAVDTVKGGVKTALSHADMGIMMGKMMLGMGPAQPGYEEEECPEGYVCGEEAEELTRQQEAEKAAQMAAMQKMMQEYYAKFGMPPQQQQL